MRHPCRSCGACCAHYRVSVHWMETDASPGGLVPQALTEAFGPHMAVMRGTWAASPRCVALDADIGTHATCTIHAQRPAPCRDVEASWESGARSDQCDRARLAHGLPVLTPADWPPVVAIAVTLVDRIDAPLAAAFEPERVASAPTR
jgi:Fe-S-cluster containining protein